jgi:uncharacterized spore protein YtfJ
MKVQEIAAELRNELTVSRVFGEPVERGGVTVLPVAAVRGGAGGGESEGGDGRTPAGSGGGVGFEARPLGVYVISGDRVVWQPAVDVTRIAIGGQIVGFTGLLLLRSIIKRRKRRPRRGA